jgi:alkanesulfonate monooxygenase
MSVEFIGMIGTQPASEIHSARGPTIDIDYVRRFSQAHEQAGFDRILIGYFSNGADGFVVASYAAFVTQKLGLMLAHRPGFVAPTLAARKLATLDHFSGGRLAVHIISGGDDADQGKDGDFLTHDERYARTDEYVEILRRIWTANQPVDHEGKYYTFRRSFSDVKPLQNPHPPIYFGGSSDAATQSPASTPMSMLCGESHWPRPRRLSRAFAHPQSGMAGAYGSACRRG